MHWFNITCFSRSWQDRVPPEPRQPGDLPEGFWPNRALLRGGRRGQQSSPSGGPGQPAVPFPPAGGPNGGLPAISQHPSPLKYTTYPLHTSPSHGGPLDAGVIPLCPLPWSATTPPHHLYHHDKHKHTHTFGGKLKWTRSRPLSSFSSTSGLTSCRADSCVTWPKGERHTNSITLRRGSDHLIAQSVSLPWLKTHMQTSSCHLIALRVSHWQ